MTQQYDRGAVAVIPAFNESGKIGRVVGRVPRDVVDEVLVINDGSTDGTAEEAKAAGAHVLSHTRRMGIGVAIRDGLDYAQQHDYEFVVVMAGNGKDDPTEISRLLEPLRAGKADYVQGSRYLEGGRHNKMPLHRRFATRLYPLLIRLCTGFPATDATNGFRAYRTAILADPRINIHQRWLDDPLEYYLHIRVIQSGHRVMEVPVTKYYPQGVSYSKYTKVKPIIGWFVRLKPLVLLTLRLRR